MKGSLPLVQLRVDREGPCGLTAEGRVFCWGARCRAGEAWIGHRHAGCEISELEGDVIGFDSMGGRLCISRETGTRCRGRDSPLAPEGRYRNLALGYEHGCALDDRGDVVCWGREAHGRMGEALPVHRFRIPLTGPMDMGEGMACWISGGAARCFSQYGYGREGGALAGEELNGTDGATTLAIGNHRLCVTVPDGPSRCTTTRRTAQGFEGAVALGMNESLRCAIDGSGRAMCLSGSMKNPEPLTLAGEAKPLEKVTAMAMGPRHACFVTDGRLACLGRSYITGLPTTKLTMVEGVDGVTRAAAGETTTCALVGEGGIVHCWGRGTYGEMGDGRFRYHARPTRIEGLDGVAELVAGHHHHCARTTQGAVYCWGDNRFGQLGGTTRRSTGRPERVEGLGVVTRLAAGGNATCAQRQDDTICWGALEPMFAAARGDEKATRRRRPLQPPRAIEGIGRSVPEATLPPPVDITPRSGRR